MRKFHARVDGRLYDLYIALAISVVAFTACRLYLPAFRAAGGRAMSYYDEFAPAVMSACGRGFVNPWPNAVPALDAFLAQAQPGFDCRALDAGMPVLPPDSFQVVTRHLLLAAAAVWRVTGISWTALDNLAAAMFGGTLMATYLVMRFMLGRWLAVLATIVWGLSPMHLANVAHLRDYSKAPFFVLAGLAMAAVIRAQSPRALFAVGAGFGVVQGIGFGMRTDVLLNFAPFLLVLFTLGSGAPRKNIPWKFTAAAASLLLCVLVAWPVFGGYGKNTGSGFWHVSLLGLTTPFDTALNLQAAPYDFGHFYTDSYMSTVVQAYWHRVHHGPQVSLYGLGLYETVAGEYYALLFRTFPADFLTRMAGSALHVLNLPFSITYGVVPLGITGGVLAWLGQARAFVMLALIGGGPMIAALVLTLVGMRDRLAACIAFVVLGIWAAYPFLQLQGRHVFHLEIVTIALCLCALQLMVQTARRVRAERDWLPAGRRALLSAATVAALSLACAIAIGAARLVQQPRARAVFEQYADAAGEPLDVQRKSDGGLARLDAEIFEPSERRLRIQQAMLVVEVSAGCTAAATAVHVRYQSVATAEFDFSRDVMLPAPAHDGSARVFVPVYSIQVADGRSSRFSGVDVPPVSAPCVRLSRARVLEQSPLMLDARLPSDWRSLPLYQRLYLGSAIPERLWLRVARWWPRVSEIG